MKLREILDYYDDDDSGMLAGGSDPALKRKIQSHRKQPAHKFMGVGANAYVHKQDTPDQQDRVFRTARSHEGGNYYLDAIVTNAEWAHNNPYLPRVVGKKKGNTIVTQQIERLLPYDTKGIITNELLMRSLWDHMFTKPPGKDHDVGDALILVLDNLLSGNLPDSYVRDPDLLDAIGFIRHVANHYHQNLDYLDIHGGNIMWRMTGNMPQLVITDPLP